jgi:hypothetical protein
MLSMLSRTFERLRRFLREFFLLESVEKAISARTPEQIAAIRRYQTAAMNRMLVADDLSDPTQVPIAMTLYRDAAIGFFTAMLIGAGKEDSPDPLDLSTAVLQLRALAKEGRIAALPESFEPACEILSKSGWLVFDAVPADTLRQQRRHVESALGWARAQVDSRRLSRIRVAKTVRLSAAVLITVGLLYWVGSQFREISNVALHKPVTASSRHPGSLAPADNSAVVNGKVESTYGVHTNIQANPWVTVDLQGEYAIASVKIYNRGDGWFDEILPAVLELSTNGRDFVEVDRRTVPFSQTVPWVYTGNGRRARYVRVRGTKPSGYVALSEIEVYGK